MRPYSSPATWYLRAVIVGGAGLLLLSLQSPAAPAREWFVCLCVTALGAVAHRIRYAWANVFTFAAAVLLGPLPLALHAMVVPLPSTVANWRRPRIEEGYLVDSARTLIAASAAHGLISLAGGADFGSPWGLALISLAAVLFTLVQGFRGGLFSADALLADAALPFLGGAMAALWVVAPWVLLLLPVPMLVLCTKFGSPRPVQAASVPETPTQPEAPTQTDLQPEPPVQTAPPPAAPRAGGTPSRIRAFLSAFVLGCVTVAALCFLALGALQLAGVSRVMIALLGLLAVVAELTKIRVYETEGGGQAIAVSLGTAVNLAAVGIGGTGAAIVTAFAGALAYQFLSRKRRISWKKRLFNFANPVLAAGVATGLFQLLAGANPGAGTLHLVAGVVAAVAYYLTNTGVLMLMISLETGRPLLSVWRDSIWFAPAFILLGLIGAFVGAAFQVVGWMGALLFIVPILVLRYTFTLYVRNAQKSIETLRLAKQEVEQAHAAQERTLRELIEVIAAIIDARDNSTFGHSRQVARYAEAMGRQFGMSDRDLRTLRTAALLHDLGKVGVPESILKKPAKLTSEEYEIIKLHAGLGERILGAVSELGQVARVVGEHHERWDGSGYPQGKRGEHITLEGRIVAVADTLDSILSDRPYSRARPLPAALAELDRCAGSHFDPAVVAVVHEVVAQWGPDAFGNSAEAGGVDWSANVAAQLGLHGAPTQQAAVSQQR